MFLQAPTKDKSVPKNKTVHFVKISDNSIVIEDEKKFQDYFLRQNSKILQKACINTVDQDFELFVNKELIEESQENIIEQEESVPVYPIREEKYLKIRKKRRPLNQKIAMNDMNASLPNRFKFGLGWFKMGKKITGLKGGSDREDLQSVIENGKIRVSAFIINKWLMVGHVNGQ